MASKLIKGSCLCGSVQFSVAEFEPLIAHCHCTMCQKFHGAAFSTFAEVKLVNFQITAGDNAIEKYKAENKTVRSFCKGCGSSLFFESQYNRHDNTIEVALAALDNLSELHNSDNEKIKPNAHIFTQSQACWFELNDDLPKYKAYRN